MTAKSTAGIVVEMTGAYTNVNDYTDITITDITKANPPVFTLDAASTAPGDDDVVVFKVVGFPEVNNQAFSVKGTKIRGAYTSDTHGTFYPSSNNARIMKSSSFINMCLSSLVLSKEVQQQLAVSTFCDPAAQLKQPQTSYGTVTITGFIDINDAAYKALIIGESDQAYRYIRLKLPNNGFIVFGFTIGNVIQELPLVGASSFTATLNLISRPIHSFDL